MYMAQRQMHYYKIIPYTGKAIILLADPQK